MRTQRGQGHGRTSRGRMDRSALLRDGDELPDHPRTKQKRLETINEALEAVKREAEERAVENGKDPAGARVAGRAAERGAHRRSTSPNNHAGRRTSVTDSRS